MDLAKVNGRTLARVDSVIQRIFSAVALILAGATGAVLLWPGLFPDIALPAFLAGAPLQRTMLGVIVSFATGIVLLGLAGKGLNRPKAPAYPVHAPQQRDEPVPPAGEETPPPPAAPAEEGRTLGAIMAERAWSPLPPPRETAPAAEEEEPEAQSEVAEVPPANDAEPEPEAEPAPEPEAAAEEAGPSPEVEPAPEGGASEAEALVEASEPAAGQTDAEPAPDEPAQDAVDHQARLAELTRAGDEAKAAGQGDEAFSLYADAVVEARAVHAAGPTDPRAQEALAEAVGRVALMNEAENRLDLALQQHEESLSLYRGLALRQSGEADTPDERRWVEGLVASMERLADCREARGHRSRARDLYGEAVRITQRLTWLEPGSAAYAARYAHAKTRFAALDAELQGEGAS